MDEITYTKKGDYLIPDLTLPEEPEPEYGKYGRMRKNFLSEHRKGTYATLMTSGKLSEHLAEIDWTAREQIDLIVSQMAKAEGVTEEMKASDPMKWTGLMNNLRHSAEELVLSELIYN